MTSATNNSWEDKESSCRGCNKNCDMDNNKPNEQAGEKHSPSCTVISSNEDESCNYPPEKIEKRRLSLDFFFGRRSSHGKLKINRDKRGSISSNAGAPSDDVESGMPVSNQRRRSSTRMEGNSDLVAWCFI